LALGAVRQASSWASQAVVGDGIGVVVEEVVDVVEEVVDVVVMTEPGTQPARCAEQKA